MLLLVCCRLVVRKFKNLLDIALFNSLGLVWVMSESYQGHDRVVSGLCQGHVRVVSGLCQGHVRIRLRSCLGVFSIKSLSNKLKSGSNLGYYESILNYSISLVVLEAERVFSLVHVQK